MWWFGLALASAPPPAAGEMHARFDALTRAREGVVQGRLEAARGGGAALTAPDPGAGEPPAEWKPWLARLEAGARELERAPDLRVAGAAVSKVAGACAECHDATGGGPALSRGGEVPPQEWSAGQNMPLHAWAVDWMWLGLLANDDEAWDRGARELDRQPLALRFEGAPPGGTRELEQGVYLLAGRAREVEDRAGRVELYGQLITLCAECHTRHRNPSAATPQPAPGVAPGGSPPSADQEAR